MKVLIFFYKSVLNFLVLIIPKQVGKHAYYKLLTPITKPLTPFHKEFLEIGKGDTLFVNNVPIQTYKWGYGDKKILMIHGWASHSFWFKSYIESFDKSEFTLYALDAYGHGMSGGKYLQLELYAGLINAFITKTGKVDILMGHSFGGFACTYYMYKYQDPHVQKVIVMAAPARSSDFFNFAQEKIGLKKSVIDWMKFYFEEQTGHPDTYYVASEFAKALTVPCLIIHDKEDKDTNHKNSISLHENWKESQLILTEGLGHNLKGPKVYNLILQFIESKAKIAHSEFENR
jgi:pimeloyl-ACP methyl ester carboxylesterase